MADTNLIIIAKVKAKPGMEAEVKKELMALIGPTRSEEGCVQYNLHQSPDDSAVFMFYENWISQEAFNEHIQTMHLQGLLGKADELFAEPLDVTSWEIID